MGREETKGCHISKCTDKPSPESRPQRVTGILNQPESISSCEVANDIHIAWTTQCMRDHDRPGLFANRPFDQMGIDIVGPHLTVDKYGHQSTLDNRRKSRRKGHCRRDHLVSDLQWLF